MATVPPSPTPAVPTIPALVDRQAAAGSADALIFPDERVTYAGFAARSRLIARSLHGLGVVRGDRVGLLAHGSVDLLAAMVGTLRLGAVAVPVNARYKGAELAHLVADAGLAVLLVGAEFLDLVAGVLPAPADADGTDDVADADPRLPAERAPIVVALTGEPHPPLMSRAAFDAAATLTDAQLDAITAGLDPDDLAMLLYTSGTTAHPKGCMHSHATLLHVADNLADARFALGPDDRFWSPLPLFHVGGIDTFLCALTAGCAFVHPGLFTPEVAVTQLVTERCTVAFPAFETIWLAVLDGLDAAGAEATALRLVVNVGVPERLRAMQARLPGAVQVSAVGMTEAGGFISVGVAEDPLEDRVSTGGHPLPGMQVRLRDPETGADLPPGSTGELLFRGVSRLLGYWGDAAITAERIDADGWYHSGDLVRQDPDGRITFVSRLKDMLKVGGENVAAAEIEDHLARHPAVAVVQVVAAPDARYIEVPAAFVQLAPGATATEQELIDHCLGRIATFKVPRYVRFVTSWPMSGTKVQKYRLREAIAADLAAQGITEAPRLVTR